MSTPRTRAWGNSRAISSAPVPVPVPMSRARSGAGLDVEQGGGEGRQVLGGPGAGPLVPALGAAVEEARASAPASEARRRGTRDHPVHGPADRLDRRAGTARIGGHAAILAPLARLPVDPARVRRSCVSGTQFSSPRRCWASPDAGTMAKTSRPYPSRRAARRSSRRSPRQVQLARPPAGGLQGPATAASPDQLRGLRDRARLRAGTEDRRHRSPSSPRRAVYDDTLIHRIEPGFVIQGGDPLGDGTGGPGYFVDEPPPQDLSYTRGIVAMAKIRRGAAGALGKPVLRGHGGGRGPAPGLRAARPGHRGHDVVERIESLGRRAAAFRSRRL